MCYDNPTASLATAPDSIRQKTHVGNVCVFGFVASCRSQVRDQTGAPRVDDDIIMVVRP